ncbi:MAG: OmpH family outer membrane protein [Bacteroidetes bacterium]|nr:OmpH family outer membrane protein [Bacteroidota bacterium]
MKQLKTTLLVIVATVALSSFGYAQGKIAHINTQEIIQALPDAIAANKQLEKLEETYRKDIQASATEYQKKLELYESEAETQPKEVNQRRATELAETEARIRDAQQSASQDLQKKRSDLYAPIMEKVRTTIQTVAKQLGYEYVLDVTTLIVADGKDLSPEVKKALGI